CAETIGEAPSITHHRDIAGLLADADEDALAGGPWPRDRMLTHVADHLLVDPLCGATERELAEGGEVAWGGIVADGALCLLRQVDLAFLEALDQILGGEIDELDLVGPVDDPIRHRLAHADAGDLGDDVVEALDMLDVERRIDVDAGSEQL